VSHSAARHEVRAAGRLFRLRIRLSSAMWVPVLGADALAVALGIGLPILDQRLGDEPSLPLTVRRAPFLRGEAARFSVSHD